MIAGAPDALFVAPLATLVRRRREARGARRSPADSGSAPHQVLPPAGPRRSSWRRPSHARVGPRHCPAHAPLPSPPAAPRPAPRSASSSAAGGPCARARRACTAAGSGAPAQSRTAVHHPPARRAGSAQPHVASQPRNLFVSRVRSWVNAVRSRLTWRAASSATVGTRTSRHTSRSPLQTRTSIAHQFQRIEPIRLRPPRPTIDFDARRIHHPVRDPLGRQRAMNPEAITSRLVATHHRRRRRQPQPRPRLLRSRAARRRDPRSRTVRSHGCDADSRRHRQLPLLRAQLERHVQRRLAYTHLWAGRCDHHSLLSALNTEGA